MSGTDPFISALARLRRHENLMPQRHEQEKHCERTGKLSAACDSAEATTVEGVAAVLGVAAGLADEVPVVAANLRALQNRLAVTGLTPAAIEDVRSWLRITTAFAAAHRRWDAEVCIATLAKALAAAERLEGAMPRSIGRRASLAA